MTPSAEQGSALHVFLIATEESGDRLGAHLIAELQRRHGGSLRLSGVGGRAMESAGLRSLFPIEQLSLMGFVAVARELPMILRRLRETADAVLAARPDVLVLVDAPDFTHRVARRVRARAPEIPIVDYVSPTVWAWRPGRARAMRAYVDRIMAILPFEPDVHRKLGGPPCTYVGHPLIEQIAQLRPDADEQQRRAAARPVVLVMPGSRRGELKRLLPVFGAALARLMESGAAFEAVMPTLPHLQSLVEAGIADWPVKPRLVVGEAAKLEAFRAARAALVKSGTSTLELALAGVPMVTAYRVSRFEAWLARQLIQVHSVILANLVLGENVVPEFLQDDCTAENLAANLSAILRDGAQRTRQMQAFARLDAIMGIGGPSPGTQAAEIVENAARPGGYSA